MILGSALGPNVDNLMALRHVEAKQVKMKLLTHNFLSSRFLKNVTNGYPLILRANQIANKEVEFNENFVLNMMPKLDYASLYNAAYSIGEAGNMPATLPDDWETNTPVLME
ncbi:hypothetical protein TELCIR_22117, partial [Teladorsagia circumcincta]